MVCGCVLIFLFVMFNGGIGGAKLSPGVYVQESSYGSSGGVAQVGKTLILKVVRLLNLYIKAILWYQMVIL